MMVVITSCAPVLAFNIPDMPAQIPPPMMAATSAKGMWRIAGSGMCTGGRIRHHLKHNLWRRDAHVMIVGYQARGTPGRALVDGTEKLRLAGEEIAVRASIHTLGGFSAHASQSQLLDWVGRFSRKPERILLVHGEDDAKAVLQQRLHAEGYQAAIPVMGQKIEI
jgi:Cft2 family RNA processing exonuclease